MEEEDIITFIFNDEQVQNSHGFSIQTNGIDTKRFEANPVMLNSHQSGLENVIGSWENIKKTDGKLTASPVFDSEDEKSQKIAGKVARGFIKACSMGIAFNPENLKMVDGKLTLTKSELYESSVVAVPSNANAVRLYHQDSKKLMTKEEVQTLCLSISNPKNNTNKMKIELSIEAANALGLSSQESTTEAINAKVLALSLAKANAEKELNDLKNEQEQAKLEAITNKVKAGIKSGKFKADKESSLIKLGLQDEALLDDALELAPGKTNLSAQLVGGGTRVVETKDDFQKLSLQEQLAFKAEQPDQYLKLFTRKNN